MEANNNLYRLLKTKEIIEILDGDISYGVIEKEYEYKITISMPKLSGPDLCSLSTVFGLPVTYYWDKTGTNLSRWKYLDNLMEYCLKSNKFSELLTYLFSVDRFRKIMNQRTSDEIEEIYTAITKEIINKINGILYFGGHELINDNNKYIVQEKKSEANVADNKSVKELNVETNKRMGIGELLRFDITRCNDVLEKLVDENEARNIYIETTARYDRIIPNFSENLYSYYEDSHFYDPQLSLSALQHNIKVIMQKMIIFNAEKNEMDKREPKEKIQMVGNKVFIVHGHDEVAKTEMARVIEKAGLTAIILHEQADSGLTIIEKIEKYSDVAFAVVLYTECDKGRAKEDEVIDKKYRARQNVVFEHGYLIGKLGRENVAAFVKGEVETPGDISGVVYTSMDTAGAWKNALAKNMRQAGLKINFESMLL